MDLLGERKVDQAFDFVTARNLYRRELKYYLLFLDLIKKSSPYIKFNHMANMKTLNFDQHSCMCLMQKALKRTVSNDHILFITSGNGGCGKTVVLSSLCTQMDNLKLNYVTAAHWGSACIHHNSLTLYSLLGLYNCHMKPEDMIKLPAFKTTRDRIRALDAIVLDEVYLCSGADIGLLIKRINYIKGNTDEDKLPLSLYVFGSSLQLWPVGGYMLETPIRSDMDSLSRFGLKLFQRPDYKYELTINVRQSSDSVFQGILERILSRQTTDDDIAKLEQRRDINLSLEERKSFDHDIHLFGTNAQCRKFAYDYLYNSPHPIRRIDAELSLPCEVCREKYPPLYIGVGVRVSLTRNKIISRGLVNSSEARVTNIYYSEDDLITPKFVLCNFEKYTGLTLPDKSIPLPKTTDNILCKHFNKLMKVSYFPLTPYISRSIHKSQSHSYQRVVINFDNLNNFDRRIYVALSRCVKLSNLMITSELPLSCYFRR